ncbi:MAG: hypothetical protein M5R36_14960 [Deltaproteobacteria bacterium]|nr:hypothetical protein [Deltaproteobacteria bacterium]
MSWLEEGFIRSPFYGPAARVLFSPKFAAAFERFYRGGHDRLRTRTPPAFSALQARLGLRRLTEVETRHQTMNRRFDAMAAALPSGLVAQKRDLVGSPAFYNLVALSSIPPATLRREAMRRGVDIGLAGEVADDCAAFLGASDCPVAADVHARAALLPLYEGMSERRFRRVTDVLRDIFAGVGTP